jgi:hypothetical protein
MQYIFITGIQRSGTTLVEKVLCNHAKVFISSQPMPFVYYHLKRVFLESLGVKAHYPLSTMFDEPLYDPEAFIDFLKKYHLNPQERDELFTRMSGYGGNYSPELIEQMPKLTSAMLWDLYNEIVHIALRLYAPRKNVHLLGSKEVICEEYIPFFIRSNARAILILRDPRDVLLSTNSGDQMGKIRPTLHYMRTWRKSVAFALLYRLNPYVLVIKYEDMVRNPAQYLSKLAAFFEIESFPDEILEKGLVDQKGNLWQGNSNFAVYRSISDRSVGLYRKKLSPEAIRYVETVCFPEMIELGYQCDMIRSVTELDQAIQELREPFTITRPDFDPDFSHQSLQLQSERARIDLLLQNQAAGGDVLRRKFIFPEAYERLRNTIREHQKL